ncbi:MAG: DUF2202 domain-containing protein [Phycisphaerales bacterium]
MNTKLFASALATFALLAAAGCAVNRGTCCETGPCGRPGAAAMAPARGVGPGGGACVLNQNAPVNPTGTITPASADALRAAWLDERRAQAFYGAVLEKHGQIRPFTNILNAEKRHEQAVATLMDRYGVSRPSKDSTDVPGVPATIAECAKLSAQVERDNVAMYDRLLKDVSEPDVRAVLENLRAASLNNHLPAFDRVSDRASAGLNQGNQFGPGQSRAGQFQAGQGRGAGRGMGQGMGQGMGRGSGRGLRDGTGPGRASCPLVTP